MEKNYALEITLISAQGLKLKEQSGSTIEVKTYAVAWIDPSVKLRTCVDNDGNENPTWNDQFLFKVSSDFLNRETAGVSIEIYAVGFLRDKLIGTARLLVSNFVRSGSAFNAVMIRRPSGRIHGVLNFSAAVVDGADVPAFDGVSAIGFRELIGRGAREVAPKPPRKMKKSKSMFSLYQQDCDDKSEEGDSTTTSSITSASPALGESDQEGKRKNHVKSSSNSGKCESPSKTDRLSPFIMRRTESFDVGELASVLFINKD